MLDKEFIKKDNMKHDVNVQNAEKLYGEFYGHVKCDNISHTKYKMNGLMMICERLF